MGGFVTSFTDVTETLKGQQALKEANIDLRKTSRQREPSKSARR